MPLQDPDWGNWTCLAPRGVWEGTALTLATESRLPGKTPLEPLSTHCP